MPPAKKTLATPKLAILGVGYVGLPLAINFAKHYPTIGFDIDSERIQHLNKGHDSNNEFKQQLSGLAKNTLKFSDNIDDIALCNVYIITVPTPIKEQTPDLTALKNACQLVGSVLNNGDLVVIESTVYPGATEEICIPLLEQYAQLTVTKDFDCGYSPERIRPASDYSDPTNIVKICAGLGESATQRVTELYQKIISAGVQTVPSIRVAEMSKITENAQRDIDIAFTNEIAIICHQLNINTHDVLSAADSKWDFRRFSPGFVGGHCIGVDSIYLFHKMQQLGYKPPLLSQARQVNHQMPYYIADNIWRLLAEKEIVASRAKILIMGATFKENCADMRNSQAITLEKILREKNSTIRLCDPHCDPEILKQRYDIELDQQWQQSLSKEWDLIVFTVAHNAFKNIPKERLNKAIVMDIKNFISDADWQL